MIRLLVTGKNGFIGGEVMKRLSDFPEAYAVSAVSVRNDAWKETGFSGCDAILHAAGIAHVKADSAMDEVYARVNRDLTIEIARRAKADGVKQFIFLSSIIVYGEASCAGERKIITPDTQPSPANAYGQSKLDAEKGILALADDDFHVAVIRPPMVYGKGCKGNYNMLARLAKIMPVFPAFENRRSVIHVGNLAECIRLILDSGKGGIYFPQDESIVSVPFLVDAIAAIHGKRMRFLKCLNPFVKLMGKSGIVRRAFGDMAYDPRMSAAPGDYRLYDTPAGIRKTEDAD